MGSRNIVRASFLKPFTRSASPALDSISTLPKQFRAELKEEGLEIRHPRVEKSFQSTDGTIRYLIAMADGETVETVWMPEGDGGEAGDGTDARRFRLASGNDLRLQPGRLRCELPVLPHCAAGCQTQPERRRDRGPGHCRAQ